MFSSHFRQVYPPLQRSLPTDLQIAKVPVCLYVCEREKASGVREDCSGGLKGCSRSVRWWWRDLGRRGDGAKGRRIGEGVGDGGWRGWVTLVLGWLVLRNWGAMGPIWFAFRSFQY